MATSNGSIVAESDTREKLLKAVKKEVKQIMEEAVTRKFVHEESSIVTSLCGAVEACLQHGLRKRALGLFKNSTTTGLLQKVSKTYEPAAGLVKILSEMEKNMENARKSQDSSVSNQALRKYNAKHLWIRVALFEKQLAKIIDYLVQNSSKYYEKEALLSDPVDGAILASLLVGPCALEYTRMKTPDHYWTDPPADELLQRHRIHSSGSHHIPAAHSDSPKRPGLQVHKTASSSIEECPRSLSVVAKDYVESLHQNSRSTLLYGKNNVIVQPKEDVEPLAGYLSLHQGPDGLTVKWTPNQLMNGGCDDEDAAVDRRPIYARYASCNKSHPRRPSRRLVYWDYAITVCMDDIVYLHCHQQPNSGGTLVLVGQDGVQRPPIHFPRGGHLLAFLSCLENGLLPNGQLDPPLWSQRGKGKTLPRLKSKLSGAAGALSSLLSSVTEDRMLTSLLSQTSLASLDNDVGQALEEDGEESKDYVFRIMATIKPEDIQSEVFDPMARAKAISDSIGLFWSSSRKDEETASEAASIPESSEIEEKVATVTSRYARQDTNGAPSAAVKQLCDTMKSQILSRAFYGWLSHCRHLKTVRTHLSGLVNIQVISMDQPVDASHGLTAETWKKISETGRVTEELEIYRLVYYGACVHDIRHEVWPYLLDHYKFGSTTDEREELDIVVRQRYEQTMSEWLAIEAIIRQQEKEVTPANATKSSSESQDCPILFVRKDSSLSNDVFESIDADERTHPETVVEESPSALTPTHDRVVVAGAELRQEDTIVTMGMNGSANSQVKGTSGLSPDEGLGSSIAGRGSSSDSKRSDSYETESLRSVSASTMKRSIVITNPSMDLGGCDGLIPEENRIGYHGDDHKLGLTLEEGGVGDLLSTSRESLVCPASPISNSSNGGIYSPELLDNVALNLHRIDKDVHRCDRNNSYFTSQANLDKLRNIMCTYVWENIDVGYIQGMCDLVAPLLVILDDEAKTFSCFSQLMKHMSANFPHGGAMDQHFGNMRSLIQILDPELFEHMKQNGDYTHFYFCYRWFLLDFKRELVYEDVFMVWETIWSAKHISSPHFVLFIALALVEYYREIIIDNNMDFTDIIKFFNEMAERHCAKEVLHIARGLVYRLQDLIENK